MSGRGETPESASDEKAAEAAESLSFGQTLYDEHGTPVGTIRGLEDSGVFMTTRDGLQGLSVEHSRSGHSFGEAELMWRCMECGEMGELEDELPGECPGCGAEKTNLMYWTED